MRATVLIAGVLAHIFWFSPRVAAVAADAARAQDDRRTQAAALVSLPGDSADVVVDGYARAVRSENPDISAHIAEACRRSPSFRALVDDIAASDGIVYVKAGRCPVISGIRGCLLHLVNDVGGARYLWVVVRTDESVVDVMATIAHELQHAVEILGRPEIRSGADIARYYQSPDGRYAGARRAPSNARSYETPAAVLAGEDVRAELNRDRAADRLESGCASTGPVLDRGRPTQ